MSISIRMARKRVELYWDDRIQSCPTTYRQFFGCKLAATRNVKRNAIKRAKYKRGK